MTTLNVRIKHLRDAFGIGTEHPRLAWIVETDEKEWFQAGFVREVI